MYFLYRIVEDSKTDQAVISQTCKLANVTLRWKNYKMTFHIDMNFPNTLVAKIWGVI